MDFKALDALAWQHRRNLAKQVNIDVMQVSWRVALNMAKQDLASVSLYSKVKQVIAAVWTKCIKEELYA